MTADGRIPINLDFKPYSDLYNHEIGLYVKTLKPYSNFIIYCGTAGESLRSNLGTRLYAHNCRFKSAQSTYIKIDHTKKLQQLWSECLSLLEKIAKTGFKPEDIYVPGMPLSYKPNFEESVRYERELQNTYVASISPETLNILIDRFKTRRSALRAVEARLQTLLRSYFIHLMNNPAYPIYTPIKGRTGESSSKSYLLGQTGDTDLENSDAVSIKNISSPIACTQWAAFIEYALNIDRKNLKRSKTNKYIIEDI